MDTEPQKEKTNELSNLATALSKAQGMMQSAKKSTVNPFYKSSFADLSSVFDAIREPFFKNGLSISQLIDVSNDGKQFLITKMMHSSGEFLESKMLLPLEGNPQKLGSLISYYKRYSLMAIAGLPAEDDDGNLASGKIVAQQPYITAEQVSEIEALINGNVRVRKMVLDNCNQSIASITTDRFNGAVNWIKSEIKKDGGKNA